MFPLLLRQLKLLEFEKFAHLVLICFACLVGHLGREVLKRCATQLKPHLPKKVAEEVCSPLMETIPSTTDMSKLRKEASRKRKLECLDGRSLVPWSNERPLENKELNAIIGACSGNNIEVDSVEDMNDIANGVNIDEEVLA
ncbi:hypothetical protein Tco_1338253 [Tanacetum coccineum]